MTSAHTDARVDEYIAGLPDCQQAICQRVREIAHAPDPGVEETVKHQAAGTESSGAWLSSPSRSAGAIFRAAGRTAPSTNW